jgi:hypothetical protein
MRRTALPAFLLACSTAMPAQASLVLLARGALSATSDLSGLSGTLENGLAANVLGGLGSGFAYAGGNTFVGVPDRGPNATAYNAAVDNTVSYISRLQTMTMQLSANAAGASIPFTLTPKLDKTTLLWSATPPDRRSRGRQQSRRPTARFGRAGPERSGAILFHRPVGQFRRGRFG